MEDDVSRKKRRLDRVNQACNTCRSRKVKCDGNWPCTYCSRRDLSASCSFETAGSGPHTPPSAQHTPVPPQTIRNGYGPTHRRNTTTSNGGSSIAANDTVVPLAGQLLRDAEGKAVFIGDCAPLSFLRAVRQLVGPDVDPAGHFAKVCQEAVSEEVVRASVPRSDRLSEINDALSTRFLGDYRTASKGLIEMFDPSTFDVDLRTWSMHDSKNITSSIYHLVMAIGAQETNDSRAAAWFEHARSVLQDELCDNMNIQVVQGYTLIALYLLRAFKPNAAYLYFSLAARTAYAIGLHRSEVAASLDPSLGFLRTRIWKSLRIFDILISCLLGRPPCISDADDTHKRGLTVNEGSSLDTLEASLSLSEILEQVVVQVYGRKHISVRVAHFVSNQLKAWAATWLRPIMDMLDRRQLHARTAEELSGPLQVVSSYLYSITLLARPFLIYDVYDSLDASRTRAPATRAEERNKKKFADGAIDAALTLITIIQDVVDAGKMPVLAPGIMSWLFASSLVLGLGMFGRFGLALEGHARGSVRCLQHFGAVDPHARQYSAIMQALIGSAMDYIKRKEPDFRHRLKQASSELFGLTSTLIADGDYAGVERGSLAAAAVTPTQDDGNSPAFSFQDTTGMNPMAFPWSAEDDETLQGFLRPNFGFAMEDSFFPVEVTTFLSEGVS